MLAWVKYHKKWSGIDDFLLFKPVLRIHLILMRIRIPILDLHWKKMDPDPNPDLDPGHLFKIYWIFFNK